MSIGPETHRVSSYSVPISEDGRTPRYLFLAEGVDDNNVDPSVVIEVLTSPSSEMVEKTPNLFKKEGDYLLTLWKDQESRRLLNYWLVLYSQVPQETQSFFQKLAQERQTRVEPFSSLRPVCHVLYEGEGSGLHLEQSGRSIFEILPNGQLLIDSGLMDGKKPAPDGKWRGKDGFPYRLNLKRKPFCFEFTIANIYMANHTREGIYEMSKNTEQTISLVGGLKFDSCDFTSLGNRLRGLVTGNTQAKETEIREVVNPYVRLLEEGPI